MTIVGNTILNTVLGLLVLTCLWASPVSSQGINRPSSTPRLMIHGGGGVGKVAMGRFLKIAGGEKAQLVVIPTATSDTNIPTLDELQQAWAKRGFNHVTMLHTRDRHRANDAQFVKKLEGATAIWISGGVQERLADTYVGTKAEQAIIKLINSGVVVGGSSAGAAIQTKVMIQSGKDKPVMAAGLDLLPNAIVDQHFLKRSRLNRLMEAVRKNPNRIGIGIDEGTALFVNGETAEVVGKSYVVMIRRQSGQWSIRSFAPGAKIPLSQRE